ncbi:hypothetical protein ACI2LF_43740 [Kribbella sp. NPDC020789]
MNQMTQTQALAEGLTVITPAPALPEQNSPAARAGLASILAGQIAAVVDTLSTDPELNHRHRSALEVVLQGLGALHVDLDELADDCRESAVHAPTQPAGAGMADLLNHIWSKGRTTKLTPCPAPWQTAGGVA